MCLAFWASGLWLRYATLQNMIPSFPWIEPGWRESGNIDVSGPASRLATHARCTTATATAAAAMHAVEVAKEAIERGLSAGEGASAA